LARTRHFLYIDLGKSVGAFYDEPNGDGAKKVIYPTPILIPGGEP